MERISSPHSSTAGWPGTLQALAKLTSHIDQTVAQHCRHKAKAVCNVSRVDTANPRASWIRNRSSTSSSASAFSYEYMPCLSQRLLACRTLRSQNIAFKLAETMPPTSCEVHDQSCWDGWLSPFKIISRSRYTAVCFVSDTLGLSPAVHMTTGCCAGEQRQ